MSLSKAVKIIIKLRQNYGIDFDIKQFSDGFVAILLQANYY
jgi:hypothetical protein